jgi:type I restriction enzyme S subunit
MPEHWKTVAIGDICEGIYDGPHATPAKTASGPIFLGISNLQGGRIDLSEVEHLSEDDFVKWTRRVTPRANDIVFSYETRLGEAGFVPDGLRFCLGRRMALMRPDVTQVEPRFLLYAYLGPEFQNVLRARTIHGSTVDRIPLIEFPTFPITLPPLSEQRIIAHILGTLDDKIELNRRMNETLEALARAIFKAWFVDFDPVRAKLEGRQPVGMDAQTAALFPAEFEDSALGQVPKGWKVGSLLEIAELLSGGTPKTSRPDYWDGGILWASAKDVSQSNECFILSTERTITELGLEESSTKLIPAYTTVVVARGATTGRFVLFGSEMAMNQTCYALRSRFDCHFALYCQIGQVISGLVHAAHGSVFDTITTATFEVSQVLLPSREILRRFEDTVAALFEGILARQKESHTLATLRDALLPKLLSGEVRVNG